MLTVNQLHRIFDMTKLAESTKPHFDCDLRPGEEYANDLAILPVDGVSTSATLYL